MRAEASPAQRYLSHDVLQPETLRQNAALLSSDRRGRFTLSVGKEKSVSAKVSIFSVDFSNNANFFSLVA